MFKNTSVVLILHNLGWSGVCRSSGYFVARNRQGYLQISLVVVSASPNLLTGLLHHNGVGRVGNSPLHSWIFSMGAQANRSKCFESRQIPWAPSSN